jgi:hypothetical protein
VELFNASVLKRREEGAASVSEGKGAHEVALVFHVKGRPEDAAARECAEAVDSRSWAASRLT